MTTDRLERHLRNTGKQAFVLSSNSKRRNLSPEQKAELRKVQKKVALELRQADAKRWTQVKIGKLFGVTRQAVEQWFDISNATTCKANTPDARLSIPKSVKPVIAQRIADGESQSQVAADLGISQGRVSQIVTQERQRVANKAKVEAIAAGEFEQYTVMA